MDILQDTGAPPAGMLIHSYNGAAEMVPPLAKLGARFSFAGNILVPDRKQARKGFAAVPDDLLLLETDAPALTPPEPYRPHTIEAPDGALWNEPANLPAIADGVAQLRDVSAQSLVTQVWENASRLFGGLL